MRITQDFYDRKFKEYTDKEEDLLAQIHDHQKAHKNFYLTASLVLDLAKRAWELFESSETPEKRQLINFVFQNCKLKGKKLEYNLKEPFDMIVAQANHPKWYPG